jgi:hypothetical protein
MFMFFAVLAIIFIAIGFGVKYMKPSTEKEAMVRETIMFGSFVSALRLLIVIISTPTFMGVAYITLGPVIGGLVMVWTVGIVLTWLGYSWAPRV